MCQRTTRHFTFNPVKKEKVFRVPSIAASTWKGNLREALRLAHDWHDESAQMRKLFGSERGADDDFHAGRLSFFPTYFDCLDLEVLNPHSRRTGAGTLPIYLILSCSPSESDWAELCKDLLETLSDTLSQTTGDTRRPANEVTLWDQTVTAATLLKTGLVQNVLLNTWRDPLVTAFVDKYRWRFMRVYFDGLTFIGQAHHPTDIRGRSDALQQAQQAVKRLLEVT
ncbi:MAG TPA: RAMP superfamily CRISPR-associated protein [Alphaproteobacteria bacterium]|nr:RAMP superfamily CRISPR-associated protein [Alphaproteobacteria bacterium]